MKKALIKIYNSTDISNRISKYYNNKQEFVLNTVKTLNIPEESVIIDQDKIIISGVNTDTIKEFHKKMYKSNLNIINNDTIIV